MTHNHIVHRLVSELKTSPSNARTHSDKQVGQIADSIRSFGFNNPVLIDRHDFIIAGHGRVRAAAKLGMETVPTLQLDHLSEAQKRAYILADNRLAELAGWDKEILAIELQNLLDIDIDFEITDIGFETAEIDLILGSGDESGDVDPADDILPTVEEDTITKLGDLWLIGPHQLLCGDALASSSYAALMAGELAQMVFTDPPYNVPIAGHVSGLGKIQHAEFAMASGEMSEAEFTRFLSTVFRNMAAASIGLARIPTAAATAMIEEFINVSELAEWRTTLQHALAQQTVARREAEFRPPAPAAIAAALVAGPPATAGDLRAIITETLDELAEDIRHGDTSPWKGFWNRPTRTNAAPEPVNSPKIENDCRDLLTDRLADRLQRYGIPVKQMQTEDRSGNDRRADVMIVLGDGAASVPVEAKRHWNDELWTAVEDQLVPYCRTAGSNGHGIYLIFWFGPAWQVPALPDGSLRPTTPVELRQVLIDRLPVALAHSVDVVVIDVSEAAR